MPALRGTLVAFDDTNGTAEVRLDGSAPRSIASIAVARGLDKATITAGLRCIVDTGDHNDPADFVVTALYDPSGAAYP